MTCTCGSAYHHVVKSANTADNKRVCLWSDGMVTGLFGHRLSGIPARRGKDAASVQRNLKAGRLLLGDVELYDVSEIGDLYAAAERAAKLDGQPGTMRRFYGARQGKCQPQPGGAIS
jgi:hypothetical protein